MPAVQATMHQSSASAPSDFFRHRVKIDFIIIITLAISTGKLTDFMAIFAGYICWKRKDIF